MLNKINSIREKKSRSWTYQLFLLVSYFITGLIIGLVSKYSDETKGLFWTITSDITSGLGVWIVIGTIIALYSHRPRWAAIGVFIFFLGMLLSYYYYYEQLYGYFPQFYFTYWFAISLASLPAAYLLWYTGVEHWLGNVILSFPVGFVLAEGFIFDGASQMSITVMILMGLTFFIFVFKERNLWVSLIYVSVITLAIDYLDVVKLILTRTT